MTEEKTENEQIKILDLPDMSIISGLPQLPEEAKSKAEKLMILSASYMDSVVKELDLDPEAFYEGVGMGLKTILGITAQFLEEREKKE